MAKTTFKGLLGAAIEAVGASKVPIRAIEYDPATKRLRVEFADRGASAPVSVPLTTGEPEKLPPETKFIPGTTIPDDDSPVDAMEIAMTRPSYGLNGEAGS